MYAALASACWICTVWLVCTIACTLVSRVLLILRIHELESHNTAHACSTPSPLCAQLVIQYIIVCLYGIIYLYLPGNHCSTMHNNIMVAAQNFMMEDQHCCNYSLSTISKNAWSYVHVFLCSTISL